MDDMLYCIFPREKRVVVGRPVMVVPMDRLALAARYQLPPGASLAEIGKRAEAEGYQILTKVIPLKALPPLE